MSKLLTAVALLVVAGSYHVPWTGPFRLLKVVIPLGTVFAYYSSRRATLADLGLTPPVSWKHTVGYSFVAAIVVFLARLWLVEPLIDRWIETPKDMGPSESSQVSVIALLVWIVFGFIYGAFLEELVWRGFLMRELAVLLGDRASSWGFALVAGAVVFGLAHSYQGPAGMWSTGVGGLVYGVVYLVRGRRDLWMCIFVHGFVNTFGFVMPFFD